MICDQEWITQIASVLNNAGYQVVQQEQSLLIQNNLSDFALELAFVHPESTQHSIAELSILLAAKIPDQDWLQAARLIADFNQVAPYGSFSLSGSSQPFFDHRLQLPRHGQFVLGLLEAIQLSFLSALRFLQSLPHQWLSLPASA